MIVDKLKEIFPNNNIEVKKINNLNYIFFNGEDLKINWESEDNTLKKHEEEILIKHISFKIQSKLANKKYGDL